MSKTIAKSHKEPSRTFQAIVAGFAIGVFASLVIGLWQEVTIICRMILLLVLGVSLYFSWELTKPKNDYPNDGNDCTNNNPNRVVNSKPKYESSSRSTYKQTYSKPFHNNFLSSFHRYLIGVLHYVVYLLFILTYSSERSQPQAVAWPSPKCRHSLMSTLSLLLKADIISALLNWVGQPCFMTQTSFK